MIKSDILILGAGASGLTCAALATAGGHSVTLIEGEEKAGRKILVSGGGKCNFTNMEVTPANFISQNPHFCKSALARCTQWDTISKLAEQGIPYEEREEGRLFCTRSASDVVDILLGDCLASGCRIHYGKSIEEVRWREPFFEVVSSGGTYSARALVVATGGPSWPQIGATDIGARIAKQFGHNVIPFRPALVPFVMHSSWPLHGLSGISLPVAISCQGKTFCEALLFTHKGISGPATLQISNYWHPRLPIEINFLPAEDVEGLLRQGGKGKVRNLLSKLLPDRLMYRLLTGFEPLLEMNIAELSRASIEHIVDAVHKHTVVPDRTEGMHKAEAACGGISTTDISSKTMESKLRKRLYFTGEVLDVTGQLGGYNLQWAWASGRAAGLALKSITPENL
ncbi:NAD(P)/FAD-dependent oxidoreductase [Oleidesulfovibrio sp.]|uniref:NAD(P)/FAD-dependent oxidoreductase n=1 Tax=Oleidesulfovibrio sp. TaxID=2909707 RepID=UPI003A8C3F10